jgi:hypothetical protein
MSNLKRPDNFTNWANVFRNTENSYYRVKSDGSAAPVFEYFSPFDINFVKVPSSIGGWYYEKEPGRQILGLSFVYPDCSRVLEMVDAVDNTRYTFTALQVCRNTVVKMLANAEETGPVSGEGDTAFVSYGTFFKVG